MAIIKEEIVNGMVINTYSKIVGFRLMEDRVEDDVKYYYADIKVEKFTDSTKNYPLGSVSIQMPRQDFTEEGITIPSMYTWLKTLPMFNGVVDA